MNEWMNGQKKGRKMAAAEGSNKDDQFFKTPVPEVPDPVTDWKVVELDCKGTGLSGACVRMKIMKGNCTLCTLKRNGSYSFLHLSGITLSLIGQSRKGKRFKEPMRTRAKHMWPALSAGTLIPFYQSVARSGAKIPGSTIATLVSTDVSTFI